jgi:hypothetical protein
MRVYVRIYIYMYVFISQIIMHKLSRISNKQFQNTATSICQRAI